MQGQDRLLAVDPPYDDVFVSLRRQLAPSAIFTYDRVWIMTAGQVAAVMAGMKEFLAAAEKGLLEAEAAAERGDRSDRHELRRLTKGIASMKAVIVGLEDPRPWEPPSAEADARLAAEWAEEEGGPDV